MPIARTRLVAHALLVLEDACEAARAGRVARSPGLRLALAYLYAVGDRRGAWHDREPYDQFWRRATGEDLPADGVNTTAAAYGRLVQLRASMNAIARAAGVELTPERLEQLARARRRG